MKGQSILINVYYAALAIKVNTQQVSGWAWDTENEDKDLNRKPWSALLLQAVSQFINETSCLFVVTSLQRNEGSRGKVISPWEEREVKNSIQEQQLEY